VFHHNVLDVGDPGAVLENVIATPPDEPLLGVAQYAVVPFDVNTWPAVPVVPFADTLATVIVLENAIVFVNVY
jgi:hypothetical protein